VEAIFEQGIPSIEEYRRSLGTDEFHAMEAFSDEFLRTNADLLAPYTHTWARDPLHGWSRQWEYPWVLRRVRRQLEATAAPSPRVLDAGAGLTFFPWLLARIFPRASLHCCDLDARWGEIHARIGEREGRSIEFLARSLADTGLESSSVDVVYCISVLEHAPDYLAIIDEFSRILRPGGLAAITFDVSLEPGGHLAPDEANRLLEAIEKRLFGRRSCGTIPRSTQGLLTTDVARLLGRPDLLPWSRPPLRARLSHLARFRRAPRWPPRLTVYCVGGLTPAPLAAHAAGR
jgi:SAM-dependent methyltransferase